jgi:hypothetical protein
MTSRRPEGRRGDDLAQGCMVGSALVRTSLTPVRSEADLLCRDHVDESRRRRKEEVEWMAGAGWWRVVFSRASGAATRVSPGWTP